MADEQYRWLDRETAERLLRGEPFDNAVDATARDRAERLAETLGALSAAAPPLSSDELPGEAAALAAFRAARTTRGAERSAAGRRTRARTSYSGDAGLVRLGRPAPAAGRPRLGRPVRLGLSAALAFGMVGGVAVAAGTGVLPTPFGGVEPGPAASVSAAASPAPPLVPPAPYGTAGGVTGSATPDGTGSAGRDTARGTDGGTGAEGSDSGDRAGARSGSSWNGAARACQDVRAGRDLSAERRRALEGVAGGSTRVWKYCEGILDSTAAGQDTKAKEEPKDDSKGDSKGESKDDSNWESRDGSGDRGDQNSESGESGKGDEGGRGENGDGPGIAPDSGGSGSGGHRNGADARPGTRP
ncbi:hypothetical protein [Streptomyces sp. NPDC001315]|uniref:hypothetical protein n=1 Tax=Streptomyces sp. NPDC001315 TaxID=3364562 RepID=UPI0036D0FCE7